MGRCQTVAEKARANGWITKEEAAIVCNLTVGSVRWYVARRKTQTKSIPVKLIGKRVFFDTEELRQWKADRCGGTRVKTKDLPEARPSWPLTKAEWVNSKPHITPRPTASDFPYPTNPPHAINGITGNLVKPQWRHCMACRKLFLSAGAHERLGCNAPAKAWPNGTNKCNLKASIDSAA